MYISLRTYPNHLRTVTNPWNNSWRHRRSLGVRVQGGDGSGQFGPMVKSICAWKVTVSIQTMPFDLLI